ncbi:MAG: DUF992 domain-containing protein [Hyphomicrobiaceae bacterium]
MNRFAQGVIAGVGTVLLIVAGAAIGLAQGPNPSGDSGTRASREPEKDVGVLTCNVQAQGPEPDVAAPPADGQPRSVLCSFRPVSGAEETYAGTISGIALDGQDGAAVAWVVTAASSVVTPGMLQQAFNSDQTVRADQSTIRLVGEINPGIVLRPLADKPAGSASAKEKPKPTGFIVLGLELRLESAAA